jgi:hypothetical protein
MEKRKKIQEKKFLDQKNIKDSLTTTSTSSSMPILIGTEIFESQKTEETNIDSRKDSIPNEITGQRKFDEYLIEAIDEALTSLGAPVKNSIYFQLENNFNIPKNEIPKQIDQFSDIIHKIFGFGASRLEIIVIQKLCPKIKVNVELTEYEWPLSKWIINDITFSEYVYNARKNYCSTEKCGESYPVC